MGFDLGHLRVVVVWNTQTQSDGSVGADNLKDDIENIEPGSIFGIDNIPTLICQSAS